MKPSVRIINCARGGLIDEAALAEALNSGQGRRRGDRRLRARAAAGRPPAGRPSAGRGHAPPGRLDRGGPGLRRRRGRPAPERLPRRAGRSGSPSTCRRSTGPSSRTCGSTSTWPGGWGCSTPRWTGARSRTPGSPIRGEVAHKNTKLITASFAAGLMETALEEQVNLVNAMPLARERGIVIEERSAEAPGDFGTLIQTEVTTERKTYVAVGHALRQAVPPPGPAGLLPARRPHRRHAADLHPHGPARPDRLHRPDARRRGRQHRAR